MTDENDNVVKFPGTTFGKINPETIAENFSEVAKGLDSVIICGFTKEGEFYFATSEGEIKDNVWIIENAKMQLWEATLGRDEDFV